MGESLSLEPISCWIWPNNVSYLAGSSTSCLAAHTPVIFRQLAKGSDILSLLLTDETVLFGKSGTRIPRRTTVVIRYTRILLCYIQLSTKMSAHN